MSGGPAQEVSQLIWPWLLERAWAAFLAFGTLCCNILAAACCSALLLAASNDCGLAQAPLALSGGSADTRMRRCRERFAQAEAASRDLSGAGFPAAE